MQSFIRSRILSYEYHPQGSLWVNFYVLFDKKRSPVYIESKRQAFVNLIARRGPRSAVIVGFLSQVRQRSLWIKCLRSTILSIIELLFVNRSHAMIYSFEVGISYCLTLTHTHMLEACLNICKALVLMTIMHTGDCTLFWELICTLFYL